MFIAALFSIAKIWMQPVSINRWMDLEDIMLSEISQRKTNIVWYYLYVESRKYNKLVNITKKEADSQI